jgi:hypothetical protein
MSMMATTQVHTIVPILSSFAFTIIDTVMVPLISTFLILESSVARRLIVARDSGDKLVGIGAVPFAILTAVICTSSILDATHSFSSSMPTFVRGADQLSIFRVFATPSQLSPVVVIVALFPGFI